MAMEEGLIVLPFALFVVIVFCLFLCKCINNNRKMQQGEVMTLHPPPLSEQASHILRHDPPSSSQHMDLPPPYSTQQLVSPPYPTQQFVPPPYDTQPMCDPSAPQQFQTSYVNPNYVQPPANTQYGEEKY